MKKIKFQSISDTEVQNRSELIQEFCKKIISNEEKPLFISDDATIFDICSDDEHSLIINIANVYGVHLSNQQLQLKLWQLIDLLTRADFKT